MFEHLHSLHLLSYIIAYFEKKVNRYNNFLIIDIIKYMWYNSM